MKGLSKPALLVAVGVAALAGSLMAARALRQAIDGCQNLYRIDTAGSQIEGDLEYQTQESRRAFLFALAITDPNDQLPHIDEARQASRHVREAVARLRKLGAADVGRLLDDFDASWTAYTATRDEIVALILEGDSAAALQVEQERGGPAFESALAKLHALKSALESHARVQSRQVDATLQFCAASLAGFLCSTILIVASLSKANRDRHRALESLKASNGALQAARQSEEQRASILEMVSSHATLSRTLGSIVELAPRHNRQAGAAIWAVNDDVLQLQVAANVPQQVTDALGRRELPREQDYARGIAAFARDSSVLAARFELHAEEPRPLLDAGGRLIGVLQAFTEPIASAALSTAVLDQMARLAAVAIDNTLLHERLAFQAQHDTLTGLPNRLLFQDRVQQATRLASRHRNLAAVIWIDLDRFKQINDTLGHRAGDELLCEVARRLKDCLRASDSVARVGGDEFTVLVHDLSQASDAETVAAKIVAAIARPMLLGNHEIAATASLGVSLFPDHGEDASVLMRHADLAMYSAKRAGSNTYHLFQPSLGEVVERRVQIEHELKTALSRNELSLDYQPLVDKNGRLDGLEALLRWTNPTLGRVGPMDFIPVAEEMGLILPIGEWVLRTACFQGSLWLRDGLKLPRIAVNVSAAQFVEKGFAAMVGRALRDSQFPPVRLEIEITETALMNSLEQAIEQIEALRDLGVRFAIDDFGTGYSSLSQLRTLPVDCVKIDRSFIKDLEHAGGGCTTLVRGIIALAHNLDLEVVAEGVETEEQLDLLHSMGCDISQGYFLYRPMSADKVEELLRQSVDSTSLLVDARIPLPA